MTYAQFLLVFLLLPIVFLTVLLRRRVRRAHLIAGGLVCLIAFVYTTPWDNYAAYKRLWTFDPAFVLGPPFWLGWLPLEEYLFYFAEAVFVCLVLVALSRIPVLAPSPADGRGVPGAMPTSAPREAEAAHVEVPPLPSAGEGKGEGA